MHIVYKYRLRYAIKRAIEMKINGRREEFLASSSLDFVVWAWLFVFKEISSVSWGEISISLCNNRGSCDWGFGTGLSDSTKLVLKTIGNNYQLIVNIKNYLYEFC